VGLYIHSPIHLHGVVLTQLSTGTILPLDVTTNSLNNATGGNEFTSLHSKGASTLLVLVLVLARLVLVGRLVWLLFMLVNLRPHYFSCSPGFGA
jgi:hypothetical protein